MCFTNARADARERHKRQGHASRPLQIGDFVAYVPDYAPTFPSNKKQDFFLGKVLDLDAAARTVKIQMYHTSVVKNLTSNTASYRVWLGKKGGDNEKGRYWISLDVVLEAFNDLTKKGRLVDAGIRKKINNALILYNTIQEEDDQEKPWVLDRTRWRTPRNAKRHPRRFIIN